MECYKGCTDVSPYPSFDRLNMEYAKFFSQVLKYCAHNKTKVFADPHPGWKQPSYLRIAALKNHGFKAKLFKMFKKAVVVAVCAYLASYLI